MNKGITELYDNFYNQRDKVGKTNLTKMKNFIEDTVTKSDMAKAMAVMMFSDRGILDAKELNEDLCEQLAKGDL